MEYIFRDESWLYYKSYNTIKRRIKVNNKFHDIPNSDSCEVLYHYKDTLSGYLYPVYYESINSFGDISVISYKQ